MKVTIVKKCHIAYAPHGVGDVVEVDGGLGARLIEAGYAKAGAVPVIETATDPKPAKSENATAKGKA